MTKTNAVYMVMGWFVLALFIFFAFGTRFGFVLFLVALVGVLIGGGLKCLKSSS